MYLEHFQLKELPFRLSPDPSFLYLSPIHARAKAYMESTIWFTDGFVVITGEIGAGKTTLIETFLKELEGDVVVAQINQTQLSPTEFMQTLLAQFGFNPFRMKKAEILVTLNNFLIEQYASGRKVLLIIDEAQNLSNRVLEEVRLLSGIETTKEKVLRIVLAGQPELNDKLDSPELIQLRQRVRLRFHLSALGEADLGQYIQHRLDVAGANGRPLFAPATLPTIFKYTGGIPRLINTLCDTALLAAFAQDELTVTPAVLRDALDELRWEEYAARTQSNLAYVPDPTAPQLVLASAKLVVSRNGETLSEHTLSPGRLVIGRTSDNDIRIESRVVSRHHAQITTSSGETVIEDLNSTNGMFVRGRRVRRHKFAMGDSVLIAGHSFTLQPLDGPTPATHRSKVNPPVLNEVVDEDDESDDQDDT